MKTCPKCGRRRLRSGASFLFSKETEPEEIGPSDQTPVDGILVVEAPGRRRNVFGIVSVIAGALALAGAVGALFYVTRVPRIDASDEETLKASYARVRSSLTECERDALDRATLTVMFEGSKPEDIGNLLVDGLTGLDLVGQKARGRIHGFTATDLIAEAEAIEGERKVEEGRRLRAAKIAEEKARRLLDDFRIEKISYSRKHGDLNLSVHEFDLTVENLTGYTVSAVHLDVAIKVRGRVVPLSRGPLFFSMPGDLEPGERKRWIIRRDSWELPEWDQVSVPSEGAYLDVKVTRLDGADGKMLIPRD